MPPEEEKRQEKLLLLLLALARQAERQTNLEVRPQLVESMRRLRRLIQTMSPTGQFRALEWNRVSLSALPVLEEITRVLRDNMLPNVQTLLPEVQDAAWDYSLPSETQPQELIPKTQEQLLNTLQIAGAGALFLLMGNRRGLNRYTFQMKSDLDKMVRTMIMAEATTQQISDKVIKLIPVNGRVAARVNTGSYANRMWNRAQATNAAVVWDGVTTTLGEVWRTTNAERWVWNARLDPMTCPVCRPLHMQVRSSPAQFERLPPIHPNCRCAVLPILP